MKYETTKRIESALFPGVSIILRKMTEGRRIELRSLTSEANKRVREIMRAQAEIDKKPEDERDTTTWLELQDEFDGLRIGTINPVWIKWGVKQIEGLEVDGRVLGVEDWKDWPSALTEEVLEAVNGESELNGTERKNSPSPTTSGVAVDGEIQGSTAPSAAPPLVAIT